MKLPMKPDTDDRRTCEQCANLRALFAQSLARVASCLLWSGIGRGW